MIFARAPLRISFVGGGTDLPAFYHTEPGAVVSATIKKYVYVAVKDKFDGSIRLSYSQTENVSEIKDLKNDLVRETLREVGVDLADGLEVVTIADVPANGSGLGSSSALTVAMLKALKQFSGWPEAGPNWLAEMAFKIESRRCGNKIGKQDQYATAYGGVNAFVFVPNDEVDCMGVMIQEKTIRFLNRNTMLFYLGKGHEDKILEKMNRDVKSKLPLYRKMAELTDPFFHALEEERLDELAALINENWEYKKQLAEGISTPEIDEIYEKAKLHGALGGKVLGAGGGGFLFLFVEPGKQAVLKSKINLRHTPFEFGKQGAETLWKEEK